MHATTDRVAHRTMLVVLQVTPSNQNCLELYKWDLSKHLYCALRLKQEALLNSYVSSSSQDLSGESGPEDDLPAGPMDIDDASFSHHVGQPGQAQNGHGADQDMNEVAEILLKISNVNMNGNRQRRYAQLQNRKFRVA